MGHDLPVPALLRAKELQHIGGNGRGIVEPFTTRVAAQRKAAAGSVPDDPDLPCLGPLPTDRRLLDLELRVEEREAAEGSANGLRVSIALKPKEERQVSDPDNLTSIA